MKSYKFILFILFTAFISSCENELEIEPRQNQDSQITLSTETGIINILNGAYAIAADADVFGGRSLVSGDLMAQTGVTSTTDLRWRGTYAEFRQMYTKSVLVDNAFVRQIYARNYEIINAANTVIENVDKVSSEEKRTTMVAEANFLKSLAYFDLVRFFALPYEAGKQNTQLGVIIRPKAIYDFNTDLSAERSSVEEVYALIIKQLNDAYAGLPAENSFYPDKYAAKALLARVYLQQQNYAAARDAASEVIEDSGRALSTNYANAFNHDENQSEDIFAIQITKQTGENEIVVMYASEGNGGRGGDIELRGTYLNKFDDPDNDVRANFNYVNEDNGRLLTSKYTNQYGDVGIIRLAEMYLIRAETNFRLGTAVGDTALNDINLIRDRAHAVNFAVLTLPTILRERELELGMEGFAIHDLKRTKGSIDVNGNGSLLIPYNDPTLVFPIPLREMDTNKKITQNPGYGS
ncbi:RagB/SusD family nutrient uptake outer membrane protein [Flavobacterium sp. JLP]|uniref:RagB/SusD family nutrient uptake outer membrane protein n=1 Tax=unclassified Flavobacterium TaxID=196869 RepID=UPI001889DBBE|nr:MULTISPECIES: RagB/SusD family nutrient uptake outer membrane protein [unclassified Flavobacterium]MBF4493235.1 RagB/SusD family nutrient uptake outer membrane protein [Flavobacterium sp. MR2016-29]MBF4507498.1 RagB/SusD family nutrient uptake outer membrane protein [Flavobacterium sp. JLP]